MVAWRGVMCVGLCDMVVGKIGREVDRIRRIKSRR